MLRTESDNCLLRLKAEKFDSRLLPKTILNKAIAVYKASHYLAIFIPTYALKGEE
jgi:hypothetical protein